MDFQFIISATSPAQFPQEFAPEVAFLGRSNVGKSSLINCLVGGARLARTSTAPGCTRRVSFYRVDDVVLVDLPGYGYARVSPAEARSWKRLIEHYLARRRSLVLSLLLVDARRGWMQPDLELKRWLESRNRRYEVVATKTDKLKSQRQQHGSRMALGAGVLPFSAVTGQGVREIWQAIRRSQNP